MPVDMRPWLKRLHEEGYLSRHDYFLALEDLNNNLKETPTMNTYNTPETIDRRSKSIWASVAYKEACAELRNQGENVRPTKDEIAETATRYYNGLMKFHGMIGLVEIIEPEPATPKTVWGDR